MISDYANGISTASSSASQFLSYANPQDIIGHLAAKTGLNFLHPTGPAANAFVFDYFGDDEAHFESEITDHFSEDNSAIQDHIAVLPKRYTLRGFISEVSFQALGSGTTTGILNTLEQKMGAVPAFLGKYTPQALQKLQGSITAGIATVQNYANEATQYYNQAQNLLSMFKNSSAATSKQQSAFVNLQSIWEKRLPIVLSTPWGQAGLQSNNSQSMYIERVRFFQGRETPTRTDITITIKQVRTVPLQSNPNKGIKQNSQGRAQYNLQTPVSSGFTPTATSAPSFLTSNNPLDLTLT
ncbi:MAG: hypothetical protein KGJ13_04655 [Patescibacteria group bacterium]|nr:hypothetical protein [Patescibacteria group bacterium]